MGSVVGAMYASGYSPAQITEQAADLRLADLFSRRLRTPQSLGQRRPLVVWEPGAGGVRTGEFGTRESSVNAALNRVMLRGNLLARGDFDSLEIPFRAVATDIRTRAVVVLAGGDLAQAVRASMAIPLVFDRAD
jgi:NTE family protein